MSSIAAGQASSVPQTNPHRAPKDLLPALLICVAGVLLIFVLPLFVPVPPSVSTSYIVGFNNSVAIYAAVGLSLLTLLWTWLTTAAQHPAALRDPRLLSPGFIATVTVLSALVFSVLGALVLASHMRYIGDAGYFVEQAKVHQLTGRPLYTQIEFAYGPLLLLPIAWLATLLRCSTMAAYFVVLVLESSLGLLILAFVLNALPIERNLRRIAFVLFAIAAVTPHLGLNYTFFRFATPIAVLLFGARRNQAAYAAVWFSVGQLLVLLTSPEMGLALGLGIFVYGLVKTWREGAQWLFAALFPLLVLVGFLATVGRPYLHMAATFAHGALNLPVGPYPHLLIALFALIWLIPRWLGRFIRASDAALLGAFAIAVAMMRAALSRSDPLHVLFNGIGILVLSLAAVSQASPRAARIWAGCLVILAGWCQFSNQRPFELRDMQVLRQSIFPSLPPAVQHAMERTLALKRKDLAGALMAPPTPNDSLDIPSLERIVGGEKITTPMDISPGIEDQLIRSQHYDPGYNAFGVDVVDPVSEARVLQEIDAHRFMLLPRLKLGWADRDVNGLDTLHTFQGMALPYHQRRPEWFNPPLAFQQNLESRWTPVQSFGQYILYEQKKAPF